VKLERVQDVGGLYLRGSEFSFLIINDTELLHSEIISLSGRLLLLVRRNWRDTNFVGTKITCAWCTDDQEKHGGNSEGND